MSFLSLPFALFVGAIAAVFQLVPGRFRPAVLLAASYAFYASYRPAHALLLLGVTLAVHRVAIAVEDRGAEGGQLRLVGTAVAGLVLLLAAFKVASALPGWSGASAGSEGMVSRVLVPLGLSYYLFKLIGYLLDVYWETVPAQRSVVALALYASFFPQIVSGPIERAGNFFDQLSRLSDLDPASVEAGLRRILFGLFKKIAVADRLAPLVEAVHARPAAHSSLELLLGAYLYAVELYADFSGLTDIAIGLGQLFGIRGPENFDLPFFARNLQEYWRRWHMSLTSWLADYFFTPLRMALRDRGDLGLALAVLVNMVAIGVWHGATLTYAAFGLLHGVLMVISVFTLRRRDAFFRSHPGLARIRAFAAPLGTFHLVAAGLVFFRASSLGRALEYFSHLVPVGGGIGPGRLDFRELRIQPGALAGLLALAAAMELANWAARQPRWSRSFLTAPRVYRWALYYGVVLVTLAVGHLGEQTFIYAQF